MRQIFKGTASGDKIGMTALMALSAKHFKKYSKF